MVFLNSFGLLGAGEGRCFGTRKQMQPPAITDGCMSGLVVEAEGAAPSAVHRTYITRFPSKCPWPGPLSCAKMYRRIRLTARESNRSPYCRSYALMTPYFFLASKMRLPVLAAWSRVRINFSSDQAPGFKIASDMMRAWST